MSDHSPVNLTPTGPPETVLPPAPADAAAALRDALAEPPAGRRDAVAGVVARYPRYVDGWAELGALGRDDVERYASYRIGYHRGLDTLRANGWRGSGFVRWSHATNAGSCGARRLASHRRGHRRGRRAGALCAVPPSARSRLATRRARLTREPLCASR